MFNYKVNDKLREFLLKEKLGNQINELKLG